ncbi:magnesium-translocating P-type ATPase [Methylomonas rapida]|uniref:Magnesium-transporting ATPase, P-type 1 n=1 Tax=Methylomonas rapida TaxID=2963939 RepID=A0ABY7GGE4_9GAMM|nr:magnesium-translocating P-type ATPase [Methylomonas rapida]WAR44345.1 magnesium-translocating P-type ATPase [Methylomonas rapida]
MSIKRLETKPTAPFWHIPLPALFTQLQSQAQGLSQQEAEHRLKLYGHNRLRDHHAVTAWQLLLGQFKSSIILILLCATLLSFYLHDKLDALIILGIILISALLGFWQEKGAADAVGKLMALVQIQSSVLRDGVQSELPAEHLVPGDIVTLRAGDIIPADCRLLTTDNLFVDEAILTGESYPAEKSPGDIAIGVSLSQRHNCLWMGSHVQSGSATALVVATGTRGEFGKLSERINLKAPETEFERGIRRFGYLLMEVTLILVILIFAVNVYLDKPVMESFLFALALAVGLTPQLLPAVISVNLAHGAKRMAEQKVIVKKLSVIEDFGSMNVLCSDKTGTLTMGTIQLKQALDVFGKPSEKVARYAYLNSYFETGFNNPIDQAVRDFKTFDVDPNGKVDEIPYDFHRKRLSMLVEDGGFSLLICKGALDNILAVCSEAEDEHGSRQPITAVSDVIQARYADYSSQGFRTLGLAYKPMPGSRTITKADETDLCFLGFLTFMDPPKPDCTETIAMLKAQGVTLKIITGDNRLVAETVAEQLGLDGRKLMTGGEIGSISESALIHQVAKFNLFAEVEPNQKERIIVALKKAGYVVGYMGDGINDVSALHAADVGISVDSAADVAKETAQIVLLEKNLRVLLHGIREGRLTFANTLKYVFMATSANFGNMFSMAGASLFLPFLPLLPKQILLTNLLTDFPEMTIATDHVDEDLLNRPRRWNIQFIRRFMVVFGMISSLFDFLTFAVLLTLQVPVEQFRTGWFTESVISAALIVFVVRSHFPMFASRPGKYLLLATTMIVAITLALPYSPVASALNFSPLPLHILGTLGLIILLYLLSAELAKRIFYRHVIP